MNNFCIILWTVKNTKEAKEIVKTLLEKKLIACATLLDNACSMYVWKQKIETEKEVQVIIKSKNKNFDLVQNVIKQMCSYEVPEILAIDVRTGLKEYLNWLDENIS